MGAFDLTTTAPRGRERGTSRAALPALCRCGRRTEGDLHGRAPRGRSGSEGGFSYATSGISAHVVRQAPARMQPCSVHPRRLDRGQRYLKYLGDLEVRQAVHIMQEKGSLVHRR
jgi:hypothetical protein